MQSLPIAGVLVLALSAVLWAADKVQLRLKTGVWDVTTAVITDKGLPVPAAILEKLTPEQRARLEERMKARSAERTTGTVSQRCVTSEELRSGVPFLPYRSCTRKSIDSAAGMITLGIECTDQAVRREGTLRIQRLEAGFVKGEWTIHSNGEDHAKDLTYGFTASWRGSGCGRQEK
jgi:hypothetical protein